MEAKVVYVYDVDGAMRHIMSEEELLDLYHKIDNFMADCTKEEVEHFKQDFIGVKTLIHQRIQQYKRV